MADIDEQLRLDRALYGASYERRRPDGTRERINPTEIIITPSGPGDAEALRAFLPACPTVPGANGEPIQVPSWSDGPYRDYP